MQGVGALLVVALLWVSVGAMDGFAEEKVDKAKLNQLNTQKRDLDSRARNIRAKKQQKLQRVRYLNSTIYKNQQKLEYARRSLHSTELMMSQTKARIVQLKSQIDQTLGDVTRLEVDAGKRLRSLYMGERLTHLQMILDAKDLPALLDKAYFRQRMVAHDKKLLNKLKTTHRKLQMQLEDHAQQQVKLEHLLQEVSGFQTQIASRLDADRVLRDKYKNDAAYYERAEKELLKESAIITSQIQSMTRDDNKTPVTTSTGHMIWPIRGKITSNFGYRYHPIHRKRLMHTGLDIARPTGSPIKAADGGRVIYAGWRGGYGKVVMVNHGKRSDGHNYVTLYGHMSAIRVRKGQNVSKGTVVGNVGSTGYATGPHLHFEVRRDGKPVNPRNYL